jgi:hypothetical protein
VAIFAAGPGMPDWTGLELFCAIKGSGQLLFSGNLQQHLRCRINGPHVGLLFLCHSYQSPFENGMKWESCNVCVTGRYYTKKEKKKPQEISRSVEGVFLLFWNVLAGLCIRTCEGAYLYTHRFSVKWVGDLKNYERALETDSLMKMTFPGTEPEASVDTGTRVLLEQPPHPPTEDFQFWRRNNLRVIRYSLRF